MPIRFTLRQLEYFVAVGETGSISHAAENMNVSPPSVSTSISQLEAEFGVQLFIRKHAHGLSLTNGGRRFLGEAREFLASAEGLRHLASDISETISGPLGIGCFKTVAPIILPELRQQFQAEYPDVQIRQVEGDQAKLLEGIQSAELDICLTYDLGIPGGVEFTALATLPPYVMLAASHPLAGQASIALEELQTEKMVLLDLPLSTDYFLSAYRDAGLKPVIAERTEDLALVRSMVANGFGYSLANIRSRTDLSPDGKPLKFVPLIGGPRPLRLGLVTGREARKRRIVRAFDDHCHSFVQRERIPGLIIG